ncbi:MAG: VIT domain-containing protein [Myxococcales bacterium]
MLRLLHRLGDLSRIQRRARFTPAFLVLLLGVSACASNAVPNGLPVSKPDDPGAPAKLEWAEADHTGALPPHLTGTDGEGLALVSVNAQVIVQPPLAFTELHLRFRNPEPRRREGNFEITLPPSAALSRFAMRVNETWMEGEVVERQKARATYEDFLHRRQDPALLEHAAGNQFSARVFPIEANQDKEIILSYSEELSAQQIYRLYLAGLPTLEELKVRALASDGEHTLELAHSAVRGDVVLTGGRGAGSADLAMHAGDLFLARLTPKLDTKPDQLKSLTVLFDTSASSALGFDARAERVARLVERLSASTKEDFTVKVFAFDNTLVPVYAGPASGLVDEGLPALQKRRALGASNLQGALTALATQPSSDRLLLVSDAVATVGDTEPEKLGEAVKKLGAQGLARLDVMLTGGIYDQTLAASLASALRGHPGVVLQDDGDLDAAGAALMKRPVADVAIQVEHASWWWPRRVPSMLPGQSVTVIANVKGQDIPAFHVGQTPPVRLDPLEVSEPLLKRAWARAKLSELEEKLAKLAPDDLAQRGNLEAELVSLSMRQRVLSSRTALLVLETEQDYARFNIDRTALSDILTVGPSGIQLLDGRSRGTQVASAPVPASNPVRREVAAPEGAMSKQAEAPAPNNRMAPEAQAAADALLQGALQANGESAEDVLAPSSAAAPEPAAPPPPMAQPITEREREMLDRASRNVRADRAPGAGEGRLDDLLNRSLGGGSVGAGMGPAAAPRAARPSHGALAEGSSISEERAIRGRVTMARPVFRSIGELETEVVEREFRKRLRALQICYEQQLRRDPSLAGMVIFAFQVSTDGIVDKVMVDRADVDQSVVTCTLDTVKRFRFQQPMKGSSSFRVVLSYAPVVEQGVLVAQEQVREPEHPPVLTLADALEGPLLSVLNSIAARNLQGALAQAWRYRAEEPGSVLALLALGEALEANNDPIGAARAFGSIIDLFPSRADMRRTAGNYLEELTGQEALALALDSYKKAREQRPDHPNSHRFYAFALVKAGRPAEAFQVLREGFTRGYAPGRFEGAATILKEDMTAVASAWLAHDPSAKATIDEALSSLMLSRDTTPSLRFVLSWETDANDVDFHIYDGQGGHAFHASRELPSGGHLLADVRDGYGPERFLIEQPRAFPYQLMVHYYSRGPMGVGMGKLEAVYHDGKGHLSFEERPFVIMKDRASVDLGKVGREAALFKAPSAKAPITKEKAAGDTSG